MYQSHRVPSDLITRINTPVVVSIAPQVQLFQSGLKNSLNAYLQGSNPAVPTNIQKKRSTFSHNMSYITSLKQNRFNKKLQQKFKKLLKIG